MTDLQTIVAIYVRAGIVHEVEADTNKGLTYLKVEMGGPWHDTRPGYVEAESCLTFDTKTGDLKAVGAG